MKEKIKQNSNIIIFSIVNFFMGLVCLLITKNPVAISIGADFIVGELGSKWILLLFLFLGLILGAIGLLGKQATPEQKVFARKRQIGINVFIIIWTLITIFFLCMFNSLDIIGSRVYCNIASLLVALLASVLALYSKYFLAKQTNDVFVNIQMFITVFTAEITGYVLLVVSYVNIFVDSLIFVLPFVLVLGLAVIWVPYLITAHIKKKSAQRAKQNEEENNISEEKILSAVNFASDMISEKATSKKRTTKSKETEEPAKEEKEPELAEEVVRSKKQTKKIAKQTTAKSTSQKSQKTTKKAPAKTTKSAPKKKTTKSTSNYKGTSKTKNIK